MHRIIIKGPVSLPEEGLLLGNGDLSVSIWQKPGVIVFSLGKGDFWDRRMDLSKNPKPAHIDELRAAVERGGVQCNGMTQNTDIAIGNVVGSNIFNIFFILGITGVIRPTPYNISMNFDFMVLGGATVVLMIFMFTLNQRKLDRWEAMLMLLSYLAYTIVLVGLEQ